MSYDPKRFSVFAALLCSLSFQKNQSSSSVDLHADDLVNVMLYTEEYSGTAAYKLQMAAKKLQLLN